MEPIAYIHNAFKSKFAIPRQSGLNSALSEVVMESSYSDPEAFRGLEAFSHIWLIWQFSENLRDGFSPTVRPPRLGGNARVGVFASRSPFRPNSLGLSCVELVSVNKGSLTVRGADLMDGTPIFDIKPYIPYADCIPDAKEGWASSPSELLEVSFSGEAASLLSEAEKAELCSILQNDPRPAYQDDPERVYGFTYEDREIRFTVKGSVLTVISAERR